jgi:DNA topoisomerase-1
VKHGDEFRSLESDDDVFNISFDAALALIRAPKVSRRRGQVAQKKTLRELTNEGITLKILAGRYGPYVTDGSVNASVPKRHEPRDVDVCPGDRAAAGTARRGAHAQARRQGDKEGLRVQGAGLRAFTRPRCRSLRPGA